MINPPPSIMKNPYQVIIYPYPYIAILIYPLSNTYHPQPRHCSRHVAALPAGPGKVHVTWLQFVLVVTSDKMFIKQNTKDVHGVTWLCIMYLKRSKTIHVWGEARFLSQKIEIKNSSGGNMWRPLEMLGLENVSLGGLSGARAICTGLTRSENSSRMLKISPDLRDFKKIQEISRPFTAGSSWTFRNFRIIVMVVITITIATTAWIKSDLLRIGSLSFLSAGLQAAWSVPRASTCRAGCPWLRLPCRPGSEMVLPEV